MSLKWKLGKRDSEVKKIIAAILANYMPNPDICHRNAKYLSLRAAIFSTAQNTKTKNDRKVTEIVKISFYHPIIWHIPVAGISGGK
jgi:hypothetical protein